MNYVIPACTCILMGYLIGSINLSYFLSKRKGYDIREHGSGNAGASNVIITMGKKAGAFVAVVDILKAVLVVRLAMFIYPEFRFAGVIAATSVITGHIFPFYMGFRGGKGLATLGGSILALDYRLFLILLLFALFIAFVTDYICFAPISCSVLFPAIYATTMHFKEGGLWYTAVPYAAILYISTVFILYRHIGNLKRIKMGKELRFSFLWNRKAEAERLGIENDDGKNYPFHYDEEQTQEHRS
ncbi:MAG: glycerol-3-phosphate 1-O-acyltransferase PlsY [Lachnospiraceae bacterium]|nr:glycerol-3-phosphate 1-O-acyltransferase PlsY [Lachnospiraceae bacterium]